MRSSDLFSLFGAIGILIVAKVGGYMFGSNPVGPFVLVASANVVVLVLALAMLAYFRNNKAGSMQRNTPDRPIYRRRGNKTGRKIMERRDFLKNRFAGVGMAGAAALAMSAFGEKARAGAHMAPGTSVGGAALDGPYLDLRTGRGNQLAYARLQSDIDFGKQKYFWFKGYVMGHRPMKRIQDLIGAQGFGVIRLNEREDGVIERICREIILYTDLRSNEVLEEWKNPFTQEDGAGRACR